MFVSLSAGENVLPSMGSEYATGEGSSYISSGREPNMNGGIGKGNAGLAKQLVDNVRNWFGETSDLMGLGGSNKSGHNF